MASNNKKRKGLNSNLWHWGERIDGKIKRLLYYRKRDRVEGKKEIRNYERNGDQ